MEPCAKCYTKEDYCLLCTSSSDTYLYESLCLEAANCPVGTFPDDSDAAMKICSKCSENCAECASATDCTKCEVSSGAILFNGECLIECPSGYYLEESNCI